MLDSFNRALILIFKHPQCVICRVFRRTAGEVGISSGAPESGERRSLLCPAVVHGCALAVLCLPLCLLRPTCSQPFPSHTHSRHCCARQHEAVIHHSVPARLSQERKEKYSPCAGLGESTVGVNVLSNHSLSPFIAALSEPCSSRGGATLPFLSKKEPQTRIILQFIPIMIEFILNRDKELK